MNAYLELINIHNLLDMLLTVRYTFLLFCRKCVCRHWDYLSRKRYTWNNGL